MRVSADEGFGETGATLVQASCDGPFCDRNAGNARQGRVPPDAALVYDVTLVKVRVFNLYAGFIFRIWRKYGMNPNPCVPTPQGGEELAGHDEAIM